MMPNPILATIHRVLGDKSPSEAQARLAAPPVHEQPQVPADRVATFMNKLYKAKGTCTHITHPNDICTAVCHFLEENQLGNSLIADKRLQPLPWSPNLMIATRAAIATDTVSVVQALAGIAETGSVVLTSSAASPTSLNFLPETQIIVLFLCDLVTHIESVWQRLRLHPLPRAVNIVTGPSRTADIEQTMQLGAHGPRRLHVILVDHPFQTALKDQ